MLCQDQVERRRWGKTGERQADAQVAQEQGGEPVQHLLVHQPAEDGGEGGVGGAEEQEEQAGSCGGETVGFCKEGLKGGKTPDHIKYTSGGKGWLDLLHFRYLHQ